MAHAPELILPAWEDIKKAIKSRSRRKSAWLRKPRANRPLISPNDLAALRKILPRLFAEVSEGVCSARAPRGARRALELLDDLMTLLAIIDPDDPDEDVWYSWFALGVSWPTAHAQYQLAYDILDGRLTLKAQRLAHELLLTLELCASQMRDRQQRWGREQQEKAA